MFDVTETKLITYTIGDTVYTEEQFQKFTEALSNLQLPVPVLDPDIAISATVTANEVLDFETYTNYKLIAQKVGGTVSFAKIINEVAGKYQTSSTPLEEEKPKRGRKSSPVGKNAEPVAEPTPVVPTSSPVDIPSGSLYFLLKEAGQEKGGFVASELVRFIHASEGVAEAEKTKIVSRLNAIVDGGKVAPNGPEVPAFIIAEAKRLLDEYVAE